MGLKYAKGEAVRIVNTVLSGTVEGAKLTGEAGMVVMFLVRYKDTEGIDQERYFSEAQLEAVPNG